MLKKLSSLHNEAKQLFSIGLRSQSLLKKEQLLELVEENLDQFCTDVRPPESFENLLLLNFSLSASSVVLLRRCIDCF